MDRKPITIADVAAAVFVPTVSNVLKHPAAVAVSTLLIAREMPRQLPYEPNEHPSELRRMPIGYLVEQPQAPSQTSPAHTIEKVPQTRQPTSLGPVDRHLGLSEWTSLVEGETVQVMTDSARELGIGVVDAIMADGTAVWLRMNDGSGRKMFLTADGIVLHTPSQGTGHN
jgi:hypothetical protein